MNTIISNEFISDKTTRSLARLVKDRFDDIYMGRYRNAPELQQTAYHQAEIVLSFINIPSDSWKMNLIFLEAIQDMGFNFLEEFEVEEYEKQLLDLPILKVKEMFQFDDL
jgi:hypothetical protein